VNQANNSTVVIIYYHKIDKNQHGAGYANVVNEDEDSVVEGIVYEIDENDLHELIDCAQKLQLKRLRTR
jgi:gamma-glutamylcyclotransferase (GGCT)/AIG2-like uncharacterized protein YtfP